MSEPEQAPGQRYDVQVGKAASKLLGKLDPPVQKRLVEAMGALSTDPRPAGVKAIKGHPGLLRLRVGNYRVVYTVTDAELLVLVVHLGHRRDVYDGL